MRIGRRRGTARDGELVMSFSDRVILDMGASYRISADNAALELVHAEPGRGVEARARRSD